MCTLIWGRACTGAVYALRMLTNVQYKVKRFWWEAGARSCDVPLPSALCDRLRAQIGDRRLDEVMLDGRYLDVTAQVLQKCGGLWCTDESFIVTRV